VGGLIIQIDKLIIDNYRSLHMLSNYRCSKMIDLSITNWHNHIFNGSIIIDLSKNYRVVAFIDFNNLPLIILLKFTLKNFTNYLNDDLSEFISQYCVYLRKYCFYLLQYSVSLCQYCVTFVSTVFTVYLRQYRVCLRQYSA